MSASRPSQFVVYEFAVSPTEVMQNQSIVDGAYHSDTLRDERHEQGQSATGREAAGELTDDLVKKLTDLNFDAKKLPRGKLPPDGALVIDGQLLNIDEGNLVSRLVIGFGLGASQLDGQVKVYQMVLGVPTELLDFKVHSDSGRMPGEVVTTGLGAAISGGTTLASAAASAGLTGIDVHRSTLRSLTNSMANRIVGYFSQYAATQGWINQSQADLLYQPQSVQDVARFFNGLN